MNLDEAFNGMSRLLGMEEGIGSVQSLREVLDGFAALLNEDLPQVGSLEAAIPYRQLSGETLTLDVVVPRGSGPFPVLVYFHGGAWVWGSPLTHRKLTFRLAEQGFLVMSVDYRLAPEHAFPAGFNDCVHAVHFASHNAPRWGGDPDRLALAGDSAGANLAAAAAIELARTVDAPSVGAVGLLYGVFDFSGFESEGITKVLVDAYLGGAGGLVDDHRVSPVKGARWLPPAHIAVGSMDPLIEDARALRHALARAGVVHDYHVYEDMPHAFAQMEFLPDALRSLETMSGFLREMLEA